MGLPNTIRADLKDKLVQRLKSMDGSRNRSRVSDTDPLELSISSDCSSVDEGRSPVKRRRKGLFLFRAIRTRKSRFGLGATRIDTGICTSPRTSLVFPASVDAEQNDDDAQQDDDNDAAQRNVVMVVPVHNADMSIDGFIDDEFLDAL